MKKAILLNLNEDRILLLDRLAQQKGLSRSDILRLAIDEYILRFLPPNSLHSIIETDQQPTIEVA